MLTPRAPSLPDLFHRRWGVPILAELHQHHGAKFITLVHSTGATPAAIRQTLDHLITHGWVTPNPGYGHPLRPEYLLTPEGEALAPACLSLDQALLRHSLRPVGLRKWSMPVLAALAPGPQRFRALADGLATITDRALSMTLRELGAVPLIRRDHADSPPSVHRYASVGPGTHLAPMVADLRARLARSR